MRKQLVSAIALGTVLLAAPPLMAQDAAVIETPAATVVVTVPEGYTILGFDTVTAEQLTGARLYDAAGNDVGEIADIVLGADNTVTGLVADIGGFMGLGEHRVLLSSGEVEIYTDGAAETRAYVTLTEEALKALPVYEGE